MCHVLLIRNAVEMILATMGHVPDSKTFVTKPHFIKLSTISKDGAQKFLLTDALELSAIRTPSVLLTRPQSSNARMPLVTLLHVMYPISMPFILINLMRDL